MWAYLRKFGLEHCDLPTMLWNIDVLLRPLTVNINSKDKKGIPLIFYILTWVSYVFYLYIYLVSMLWFVFVRAPKTGQRDAAMIALSLGICSEIGSLKLLCMLLYIVKIRQLTDDFREFDSKMVPDSRHYKNLLKYLRNAKKRAITYWTFMSVNGVLFMTKHFIIPEHLTQDSFVLYGLEPMNTSPNFEISSIMMVFGVSLIIAVSATVTTYFIIMTGYAESQLLALSDELLHLWDDAELYYGTLIEQGTGDVSDDRMRKQRIMNEHVFNSLRRIIPHHAVIKTFYEQLKEIFKGSIGIGLFLLLLGVICVLLGGLRNTYMQLPFGMLLVGLDCYIGQRMKDANVVFEQAVYDCQWENFNKENMKIVLVMLQNAQKIAAISAGDFIEVDYICLMATMKATYSTYTAFRSSI